MTLLKACVLALVLANIGFFLWAREISGEPVVVPAAPQSSIRLASEAPALAHGASTEVLHQDSAEGVNDPGVPATGIAQSDEQSASLLTNVKRCISIGPFRDVAEASRSATSLRARGYGPRQRVAEGEVWAGVWVYIPRPESHEGVDLLLTTLKKAGVDDALEMPGPDESPVISLGIFSEPKRAQSRVALAQRIGLQPIVYDRKRAGNVFWVDIDLKSTEGLLNPADLQGETAPEANRIVRLEIKGCPGP
jgi:hypothetical protein